MAIGPRAIGRTVARGMKSPIEGGTMFADWETRCLLSRVRILALGAEAEVGGEPDQRRVARSLRPLVEPPWLDQAAAVPESSAGSQPGRRRIPGEGESNRSCRKQRRQNKSKTE